ncbi:hypothetical protein JQN72_06800 [Phycicoccus sp. CSK15P-2]|uniref:hypothetical protein n=1 Tax=Phycicoccus sp. CSK15P-2 TaxID=2807627 RepID=UPI0019518720|nr:hypothetical protein [Phycicoccus sp. CSK15P-2]MBM6403951.1 hypothetical protein [Phycicoccus sp. CSK15P-2]
MEGSSSIVVLGVIALIARELKRGREIVRSDLGLQERLASNERFRTVRMQALEPVLALVIVGSLLAEDIAHTPLHLGVALAGAVIGAVFGLYRARSTYVGSVPEHKGLVLRYSVESVAALGLLIVVKLVAELDALPEGTVFASIVALLLGFLLVESGARVVTLVRYYRRDAAAEALAETAAD